MRCHSANSTAPHCSYASLPACLLRVALRICRLQVALTACREESRALEEVHFFLFGDKELQAWVSEAQATLEPAQGACAAEQAPAEGELQGTKAAAS